MILNVLWFAILFAVAFYVPGRIAYAMLRGPRTRGETFAVSTGLGLVLVGTGTMLAHGLVLRQYLGFGLQPWSVLAVSLAISAGLAGYGLRRGLLTPKLGLQRPNKEQLILAALTAVSFLFFLLNFDFDQIEHTSCIIDATSALASPLPGNNRSLPTLDGDFAGQRLGIGIFMMPLISLFGNFGYRLAYALHGLLAPGLGFALGLHLLGAFGGMSGRRFPAWIVAVLFTFSGYALEIRIFDENLMSSIFGTLALVLLLRPTAAPLAAGAAMGLYLGIRHVCAPVVPLAAFLVWYRTRKSPIPDRTPLRAAALFVLGTVFFLIPCILLHIQRFVLDGILLEGTPVLPTQHSFFGFEFEAARPLNWPFVLEPVRAPFQPYTNILHYPLDMIRRLGLLALALVPLGLIHLWRKSAVKTLTLAGWFLVPVLPVLFLSNWFESNKMGIPATALAPLPVFMAAGVAALWDARRRPWKPLALVVLAALSMSAFVLVARHPDHPLDLRLREAYEISEQSRPDLHVYDEPDYLDWSRRRFGLRILPSLREGFWHRGLLRVQLRQLMRDLTRPQIAHHRRPLPDHFWSLCEWTDAKPSMAGHQAWLGGVHGPGLWSTPPEQESLAIFTLDLTVPPTVHDAPLVPGGTGAEPISLAPGEVVIVDGVETSWSHFPMRLFLGRDDVGVVHVMLLPAAPGDPSCQRPTDPPTRSLHMRLWPDDRIPLVLPRDGVVRFQDVRNPYFVVAFTRFAVAEADGVWFSKAEPKTLSHRAGEEGDR